MFIPKCTPRRVGGFSVSMPVYLHELVKKRRMTKNGEEIRVTLERVNQAKDLPDSTTTDLSVLLAAGVSPEVIRQPLYGKGEVDFNQIKDNFEKENKVEDSKQSNTQNSQQTNSQNSQQTNINKGE